MSIATSTSILDRIRVEARRAVQRIAPSNGWFGKPTTTQAGRGSSFIDFARMRELMLEGGVYLPEERGGMLREVYWLLQRFPETGRYQPIVPYYDPVRSVVDFYANALGGRFGTDITIADTLAGDKPIHPNLKALISQVWRWSNLDMRLADFTTLAANQGTVGIRIVSEADTGRVFLDFDDRRLIRHADMDARGNVITVSLRYEQEQYDANGSQMSRVQVDEVISKYGNSLKVGGVEQLTPEQQENPLGVCPYVIVKHTTVPGEWFGLHAYAGTELTIHGINYALNQLDESTLAHVWPTWFMTSPAQGSPTKIRSGRNNVLYAQTRQGDPKPTVEALTPNLDTKGTVDFIGQRVGWLADRLPQLTLSSMGLLSGISGETLAQVVKPAEAESIRARSIYEDGFKRAIQLAISIGIHNVLKGFELGTGSGSADAAERAFDGGDGPESFDFATRPALPLTSYQLVQRAQADQAEQNAKLATANGAKLIGVPRDEVWRKAGYTQKQIDDMKAELADQDTLPPEEPNTSN